jgi:site-specific DNA recombinase
VDGRLGAAGIAPKDRTLVVVPEDADTVRSIFKRYLELGSVNQLAKELNAKWTASLLLGVQV